MIKYKKRPNGYWKKEKNAIQEAKKIMRKLKVRRLPSQTELNNLGFSYFVAAVSQHHGGFTDFRIKLGQKPKRNKYGLWKDENYTLTQARSFLEDHELNSLPSQQELGRYGRSDLSTAIALYHGGFRRFRAKLGQSQRQKEHGVWKSLKYTKDQAREILQKHQLKKLPGGSQLSEMGYSSFVVSVNKYHGGLPRIRRLLGEKSGRNAPGTWRNIKYCLQQARRLTRKHNLEKLPCHEDLTMLGYPSLAGAIEKYHGGYHVFRSLLGEEENRRKTGLLEDRDYVIQQLKKLMKEHGIGTIPSAYQLRKWGHTSLAAAVHNHHGGFNALRESLGERPRKEADGAWKSLDFTLEKAKEFLQEHSVYGTLPGGWTLHRLGYNSLIRAIQKYHGGFNYFREKFNEYMGIKSQSRREHLTSLLEDYIGEENN
ncbi:MAG: hypothetical protein Q7S27_00250 [Nanoarchaeota archaeon]|nr:hypothetical protein [Nanoarchaeota archaeon]